MTHVTITTLYARKMHRVDVPDLNNTLDRKTYNINNIRKSRKLPENTDKPANVKRLDWHHITEMVRAQSRSPSGLSIDLL